MKLRIEITEDILRCLSSLNVKEFGDNIVGVDKEHILNFGGSNAVEDVALATGNMGKCIKGTEIDPDGALFEKEETERLMGIYTYISDNIYAFETLIHQFVTNGGLTVGKYETDGTDSFIWTKVE